MIIDYDHNPNITTDQKVQSLQESVQMALNENDTEHRGFRAFINLIRESLTKLQTTETLSFTSQYANGIYCCRCGKVVTLTLTNMSSVPNGQTLTLFTLPTGWRPKHNCVELLRNPTDTANSLMRLWVNTDGTVQVYQYGSATSPVSTNASCTITFVTA